MSEFKMPQLGETVVEGTITRWLKKVGDKVNVDDAIVEVSTDKVDSEIPSPYAGTLTKIMAQEGETVAVGSTIAEIGEAGAAEPDKPEPEAGAEESETAEPEAAAAVPETAMKDSTQDGASEDQKPPPQPAPEVSEPAAPEVSEPAAPEVSEPAAPEVSSDGNRHAVLSPLVRKLASEMKVDLKLVKGTGAGGRITKQDVLDAAGGKGKAAEAEQPAAEAPSEPAAQAPGGPAVTAPTPRAEAGDEELVQVTTMRKAIADHMVASIRETARAWNAVEIDMTRIGQLRAKAGAAFKDTEGYSLTWMPFISKAVTQTLRKFPQVNATWNGDGTITRKHYVNLGIAVALEHGLIVPVIKGAEGMTLVALSRAIRDVADRARTKKLVPDDVAGGTFTITNPGPFGSILSVPIINKGQAAILAVDAIVKRPVVVTDEDGVDSIGIRQTVYMSMSWDHRLIDGAEAAQFLANLKDLLEEADFAPELAEFLPEN